MAPTGQRLSHPITGGIYVTFLQTARDTQGTVLVMDGIWTPQPPAAAQVQLSEERFVVRSGRLRCWIGSPRNTHIIQQWKRVR